MSLEGVFQSRWVFCRWRQKKKNKLIFKRRNPCVWEKILQFLWKIAALIIESKTSQRRFSSATPSFHCHAHLLTQDLSRISFQPFFTKGSSKPVKRHIIFRDTAVHFCWGGPSPSGLRADFKESYYYKKSACNARFGRFFFCRDFC